MLSLKEKAMERVNENKAKYSGLIQTAIRESSIFEEKQTYSSASNNGRGRCMLMNTDTVTAALIACNASECGKVAVLNFASFTNPGGGFIYGAMAQEEAICHSSTLYNVLSENKEFYEQNNSFINDGLYKDRALYTPSILFIGEKGSRVVDVITCAAPSKTEAMSHGIPKDTIDRTMKKRIAFMYDVALSNQVDTLILGAWGCGVFGNDPEKVCKTMIAYCPKEMSVIFAIPGGINYEAFNKVMESEV